MGAREIVIPYTPRESQIEIHQAMDSHRFSVVVAHRRLGKTVSAINQLIKSAVLCQKERPRFAYIAPTYAQSKRIAWDYLLHYTRPLGAIPNISELRVDFWDRRIGLYGSDNPDSLRGSYFDGVVLDEVGDQNPKIWNEVIRPALADRQGWAMFIGTPKGQNHFYDLRNRAVHEPGWKLLEFRASQTKIIAQTELDDALREMGQDKYDQEFECSFHAAIEGAYYGQILNQLEGEGRFCEIKRDDLCRTIAAWDLGIGDSTAIWIAQVTGQEIRLIDYFENHGVGLDWYVRELKEKGWAKAEHIVPHDVQVRELGSGKSRLEVLQAAGLDCRIAPRMGVDDGIQAVRRMLPKCWFNVPAVSEGLNCLRNYRREYDEKQKVFYSRPLHDWCFTGNTLVLTRSGTHQIMDLPTTGEVLTSCGWKQFVNPRITRKNACLVEVVFSDGYSVRCTPDHMFKTETGWKSAEFLTKGLRIQSTLTRLHNISMAVCTVFGRAKHIYLKVGKNFIEMFGRLRLGRFHQDVTYITETGMCLTTQSKTLNVWTQPSIYGKRCRNVNSKDVDQKLVTKQEEKPLSGIDQKKVGYGTNVMLKDQKIGQSGNELRKIALCVKSYLMHWSAKAATHKFIARTIAKPLVIESVKHLDSVEDVWCLTVADVEEFSLSNGALVHNCSHGSDAFRYLAVGMNETTNWSKPIKINTKWVV